MTRTTTIVTLAILSSVLTPVVVRATGTDRSAPVQQAKVETVAVTSPAPAPAAAEPACARRVKVVYAGYGEAQAATCASTADLRR